MTTQNVQSKKQDVGSPTTRNEIGESTPTTARKKTEFISKEIIDHFCKWLNTRLNVLNVIVADEVDKHRGIDLWAVLRKQEDPVPIRVKVDFETLQTGNVAVETISRATFDGPWKTGWLSHLHSSRILACCCGTTGQFRTYLSQDFFQRVMRDYEQYQCFQRIRRSGDGGQFWYTLGILVPVESMSGLVMNNANVFDLRSGSQRLWLGDEVGIQEARQH